MSMESRASLRQTLFTIIYLPIVYTVFGLVLGKERAESVWGVF